MVYLARRDSREPNHGLCHLKVFLGYQKIAYTYFVALSYSASITVGRDCYHSIIWFPVCLIRMMPYPITLELARPQSLPVDSSCSDRLVSPLSNIGHYGPSS